MKKIIKAILRSFGYAIEGIVYVLKTQKNFRFHILAAFTVIILGLLLKLSATEWILLVLMIGIVLILEMMNTSIECIIDLITLKKHPLAKAAKDTAAGAVLVSALVAIAIGCIIFMPKLFILMTK